MRRALAGQAFEPEIVCRIRRLVLLVSKSKNSMVNKWLLSPPRSVMNIELFHEDNLNFFDTSWLRWRTSQVVSGSSLIRLARSGDREAAAALKIGFWPFVREFERAIDQQSLPRHQLVSKFSSHRVREVFTGIARAVRDMKQEEGSHAAHWVKDAQCLGLEDLNGSCVSGVQALIDRSYTKDLPTFFATLAGTEFIAEELSRFLGSSKAFTNLFSRKRWIWGEVHLAPHDAGPSHLDIDIDLARAYSTTNSAVEIEEMVLQTVTLFGRAADDVEVALMPQLVAA
jgi:hypothetical protein